MSKRTASPSIGSLKSPPQNVRPKLDQNGSALPLHMVTTPNNKLHRLNSGVDIHSMDPDEIFAKYTVHEVKTVLHKLRSDVDAKQEELRLMVGERYRDLLEASTSIISTSRSSKRVVDTLARMQRIVSIDLHADNLIGGVSKGGEADDAQLKIYQCLAAHLKFLVDAPEHLWRFLERKQCLPAAWLFLLSRVVYRSLMNEDSEEGQDWARQGILVKEQFPLVQRQWESISQFRTQISHRATLSLREQDLRPQDLCAAMFTLHLLDSLPLSDALDVFLKQRSRTLQHLYQTIQESWEKPGKDGMKSIWNVLRSVLHSIVGTVGNARAVFGQSPDGSSSMITQLLVATQSESPQSIIPFPPELCLTSHALISSLPNSSHFQALPTDIRTYRPFIDLDSHSSRVKREALNTKLRAWFTNATEHLHESSAAWLSHLETIKKVWELRSSAMNWLSTSSALLEVEDTKALRILVDDVCQTRVQDIWRAILGNMSSSFRETLRSTIAAIVERRDDARSDVLPAEFLLSAPPAPSITQASLNVPLAQSSFQRFKHGIHQRIEGVTPLIDKIMSDAESAALNLFNDLNHAFADDKGKGLEASYVSDSEQTASDILDSVQDLVDADGNDLQHLSFLGRLAQKLSVSSLVDYLRCSHTFTDGCRARSRRIYDSCVNKFASLTALSARDKFLFEPTSKMYSVYHTLSLPSSPSPELMGSLLHLVTSIEKFAQFKDPAQRSTLAGIVLSRFTSAVVESLRHSERRVELQLVWDVCFLKTICDDWGKSLSEPVSLLDQTIKQSYQSLPSDVQTAYPDTSFQRATSHSLKQVRLLLSPLVASSEPPSAVKSPKSSGLDQGRHKASGVSIGGELETQPVVYLVKPSARFGQLWVASVVAQ